MRYLSVCSGIEAATVAWHPLGWQAAAYSEIDAFPRAVLQHHYPDVPLRGDFTEIEANDHGPIDILVGGTPCQSFSVAGLRGGLADDRGNLALQFCRLADRIHPTWIVWENVPGVLSSNEGRDFGSIVGALGELGYGFAYRVLDAQYFGVPQRRRRVFVVGYLGDWRRSAAVLFERESMRRNPAPCRETGQIIAALTASGVGTCGADDNQSQAGHLIACPQISPALKARDYKGPSSDGDGDGDGAPLITHAITAPPLTSNPYGDNESRDGLLVAHTLETTCGDYSRADAFNCVVHTLRGDGFDASEDGTGRGSPIIPAPAPVAFDCTASASHMPAPSQDVTPTLRSMNALGKDNGGGHLAVVEPFTLAIRGRGSESTLEFRTDGTANALLTPNGGRCGIGVGAIAYGMAVRRLTPRECERLQGFPDDYTLIPWRGKQADCCPDGPRYKALGNSMAVPVMRWIGERIGMVDAHV